MSSAFTCCCSTALGTAIGDHNVIMKFVVHENFIIKSFFVLIVYSIALSLHRHATPSRLNLPRAVRSMHVEHTHTHSNATEYYANSHDLVLFRCFRLGSAEK